MFDGLSDKLQQVFARLRGSGRRISEQDVNESLRAIRVALLEADVALEAVKALTQAIREQAVGEKVLESVRPGDMVVKIVQDEIARLLGASDTAIRYRTEGPTVILMCGLQGSGKTTTCAKLARLLASRDGRKPLLAAADLKRPAAIAQLQTLGRELGFPVYSEAVADPVRVCTGAVKHARAEGRDLVILDTAGRLHVDEELMREIKAVHAALSPDETLLVLDAMTGQDAVRSARAFHETLPLDGLILTKLDSDTRGGAALSLRHATGRPIKFAGVGEQLDKLEEFHPDRMAGRILGMGDIVSLVEKAQQAISAEQAADMQEKLLENRFTLDDFLEQLQSVKKMGKLKDIMSLLPGVGAAMKDMELDDKELVHIEAFLRSMTPQERQRVELLDGSRRRRIAQGAGLQVQALNQFLNQYKLMQKMMSQVSKGGGGLVAGMKRMMGMGGLPAQALAQLPEEPRLPAPPLDRAARSLLRQQRKELKARRKRSRGR